MAGVWSTHASSLATGPAIREQIVLFFTKVGGGGQRLLMVTDSSDRRSWLRFLRWLAGGCVLVLLACSSSHESSPAGSSGTSPAGFGGTEGGASSAGHGGRAMGGAS